MKGRLYILSTGPGATHFLTQEAKEAIEQSSIIIGYDRYIDDLSDILKGKETYTSTMTEEIKRCNLAIEKAKEGKVLSLISNGDINVFGLASLVIELIDEKNDWDNFDIISMPGVTSFFALASKAGAPISQDFCAISLSDRLTPIELISKRIEKAFEGDFVMGIYNPMSKRRKEPYSIFLNIMSRFPDRPVAIGSHLGRKEESIQFMNASELISKGIENEDINMSTLLLIANESSRWTKNKQILTPRGYLNKYDLDGKIKKNQG